MILQFLPYFTLFQEGELNLKVVYVAPDQDSDDDGDVMVETHGGLV